MNGKTISSNIELPCGKLGQFNFKETTVGRSKCWYFSIFPEWVSLNIPSNSLDLPHITATILYHTIVDNIIGQPAETKCSVNCSRPAEFKITEHWAVEVTHKQDVTCTIFENSSLDYIVLRMCDLKKKESTLTKQVVAISDCGQHLKILAWYLSLERWLNPLKRCSR